MSEPCYPVEGLDIRHYFSREEYLTTVIEVLWKERLERLEHRSGSQSTPDSRPAKRVRRKGGISL